MILDPVGSQEQSFEQAPQTDRLRDVLPRIWTPEDPQTLSATGPAWLQVYAPGSIAANITLRVSLSATMSRFEEFTIATVLTEGLYQGHGVWETSSALHSADVLWAQVRTALYAMIHVKGLVDGVAPEAEEFLLRNLPLLRAFDTAVPRIRSLLRESGLDFRMRIELLEDPEAPQVPVVYLLVESKSVEADDAGLMRIWDELSLALDEETRKRGSLEGLDTDELLELRIRASVVVTTSPD